MKMRANWLLIPAVALGLGAANGKEELKVAETPAAPAAVAEAPAKESIAPVTPPVGAPKAGAEERAAKLGFVKYLPQDTEAVVAFYNGSKAADRIRNSKLWKVVESRFAGGGAGMVPDDEPMQDEDMEAPEAAQEDAATAGEYEGPAGAGVDLEPAGEPADGAAADGGPQGPGGGEVGPATMFRTEFTLAFGKSTGDQLGNLLTQMRNLARGFVASVEFGDMSRIGESLQNQAGERMMDILSDPQLGMTLIEKARMPPMYLAFRVAGDQRAASAQEVASTLEDLNMFFGSVVEPVEVEVAGSKFAGVKVLGSRIAANMAKERESMEQEPDPAAVEKLIAAVGKKELVVVSGVVGDYVVLFIGGSTDDLKLAASPSDSLVAGSALAFSDAYASKDLAALTYGAKEPLEALVKSAGGISDITNGLRDGLGGVDRSGDTRDLEAMFQIVAEREAALLKLASTDATGMVAFWEEGLKIESFGGTDAGIVDWKASNKLSHLGESEDVLMFADLTTDATYYQKSREYVEALMETACAIVMKATDLPMDSADMAHFKKMAEMFDGQFLSDLVSLSNTFSNDFGSSLGNESALVVDLQGAAPAIPGVSQEFLDKAKVPRISVIAPVADRAKLAGSWDKMNATLKRALAKISQMTGSDIPMQKPVSSEKNGNTTWFFSLPFFTDDFMPSVTVGDKWFVASSSKLQALDMISKADAGGQEQTGVSFSLNFKALQKYAENTYKLVDENGDELLGHALSPAEKKHFADVILILDDLDKLTIRARRENGMLRSSIHFKTR